MSFKKQRESTIEKTLLPEEQQAKIDEVRKMIGPIANKLPALCSEAEISRYLRARNWNTKKAGKMLKDSIKWRLEYKPEKIRWGNIAHEAQTGKIYRANYCDKYGRTVLIMRPGFQNTNAVNEQILYLVYCMENAILNLNPDQEQMVWLISFQRWNSSNISLKVTRETAKVLQNHYPERLGLGILYDPPKIFESFWTMVKPFLEPKTFKKVRFVYSDNPQSQKTMEDLFDIDKLESAFGGRNSIGFDYEDYAQRMKEDDKKMSDCIESGCSPSYQPSIMSELQQSDSLASEGSDEAGLSSGDEAAASSNLEITGDKKQDQSYHTNDVANGDTNETQMNPPASSFFFLFDDTMNVLAWNRRSRRYKFRAPMLPESKPRLEKLELLSSNSLIFGVGLATHDYRRDHRHETKLPIPLWRPEVAGKRLRLRSCRSRGGRETGKIKRFLGR